jgi:hypothetical protein
MVTLIIVMVPMVVLVTVTMLVAVVAVLVVIAARTVTGLVFRRLHEVHRPVAGMVFVAVFTPVARMSGWHVQIQRLQFGCPTTTAAGSITTGCAYTSGGGGRSPSTTWPYTPGTISPVMVALMLTCACARGTNAPRAATARIMECIARILTPRLSVRTPGANYARPRAHDTPAVLNGP